MCFMVSGFDENLDVQGELILQDSFQVWDPKSLIRKGRERHLFLFEISLVFSKEIKDSSGHTKYVYKNKLLVGVAVKKMLWVLCFLWVEVEFGGCLIMSPCWVGDTHTTWKDWLWTLWGSPGN